MCRGMSLLGGSEEVVHNLVSETYKPSSVSRRSVTARAEVGVQFDKRLWVCQRCATECISYPILKEHREKRCRVLRGMREANRVRHGYRKMIVKVGQKVLEEWGVGGHG